MNEKCSNMNQCQPNKGAGKGDKPRNCFSNKFKENFDSINWLDEKNKLLIKKELKKHNGSSTYIYK
jgi:hypothetical protein